MTEEASINIKGPNELKLTLTISLDKSVKDLKDAIAEQSGVEADRQRLIYSGRVLKDDDQLSVYKIQTNHTIHMVKGVARAQPEASSTPQRLPAMQAGQNPSDPATLLNSHLAFGGALAGFNPFADMGVNTNDPNMLQNLMDSPQFVEQMQSMMSRPEFVDQMIAMDPNLRDNPQMRAMFQNEHFRSLMANPEFIRSMMQMSGQVRGPDGAGAARGNPANLFNAAGAANANANMGGFGGFGGFGGMPPFGLGFPPPTSPTSTGSTPAPGTSAPSNSSTTSPTSPNPGQRAPFAMPDPAALAELMNLMGAGGPMAYGGGFGGGYGGGGFGGAIPSQTTTAQPGPPPEERFQTQLQQMVDMGFTNTRQNIRALLATGGNVNLAVEYVIGGGGLD